MLRFIVCAITAVLFFATFTAQSATLVAPNDDGGTITLHETPCRELPDVSHIQRLKLEGIPLHKVTGNGQNGEHEACWFTIPVPKDQGAVRFTPIINIILKDGSVYPHDISEFTRGE